MSAPRWIGFAELEERRPEWRALATESQFPTAFADPAWVLSWWRSFGQEHEPWTFVLEAADGSLRGLAPLALEDSRVARTLTFAGGSWNGLEPLICAPGCEPEFSATLLQALRERGSEWDVWRLQRVRVDSQLARTLLEGSGALQAAAHDVRLQPFLELPADVESFEAQFGSKQRNTQRRKWRKLIKLGAQARVVDDPDEVDSTLRLLIQMRRSRAAAQGQRYKHMDERYEQFLLTAVLGLLPDRAPLWRLDLDGAMLASRLNLVQGAREHSYLLGLGDEQASLSPGNMLELQAIHEAIEQGRSELELGPGRDLYKYRLGARDRQVARMVVSSGTARSRLLTSAAAVDLRLRNTAPAEALRRRRGIVPERATAEEPMREPRTAEPPASTARLG